MDWFLQHLSTITGHISDHNLSVTLIPPENVNYFLIPTVKTNFLISGEMTPLATSQYHKALISYYLHTFQNFSAFFIFFKFGKTLSSLLAVTALLHRNKVKA